ncbi:MAG TPA: two-component regulator propeller domain-containing protein [Ginsengibacter sp.]|nr:two-component regulator propeller domain-containing protein [Ginsengibacter sp.]
MGTFKIVCPIRLHLPKVILTGLLLAITFTTEAQPIINPHFTHFTINNGLSQSLIYSITQDHRGFMWFGTKDGLNRFDGYDFKVFHHDPFDSTSISDNAITVLFTDSRGRLWVGTMNGNVDLYDNKKINFTHLLSENFNRGNINSITEDPTGNIWIGTYGNGIFKMVFNASKQTNIPDTVIHYVSKPGDPTTLKNNLITDIFADSKGGLWVSTIAKSFQYAQPLQTELKFVPLNFSLVKAGRKLIPQGIQYDLSATKTIPPDQFMHVGSKFLEDEQHRIWWSTTGGIFLLDQEAKKMIFFEPLMPGLSGGNTTSICNTSFTIAGVKTNAILIGFLSGAGILDTKHYTLQLITHDPGNPKSLAPGSTLCVYQDRSGCLWLGSSGSGLSKLDTRATLFPIPEYHTADGSIRTENLSVRSFLNTRDYLFIGTQSALMMADKATMVMKVVYLGGPPPSTNLVFSIAPADDQSCWLGTNSGLYLYNYKRNTSKLFLPNINKDGQVDNRIFKIYRDNQGNLWCLTPYSLSFFNTQLKTFTHYFFDDRPVNGYTEPTYGDIYQEPTGNFWLATGDGLLYFNNKTKAFTRYVTDPSNPNSLSFNAVRTVLPDPKYPDKYLWIATAGGGLNRLDLKTKIFSHFTDRNGLPNNVVYGILADNRGNLWMSTNQGISMFNPSSQTFANYDINSGLQSNEFNSGAYYKDQEGNLYFGGINGFNTFSPENTKGDNYIPQLAFTGFSIFNRPVTVGEKGSPLTSSIIETKRIVLPYNDNIISFLVAALDFSDPDKKEYAYRLIPSNKSWIQLGSNRLITFSNLSPGNYTLQVKAGNKNGSWNEEGISLNLVILPPWWRTWWAYIIYLLALITILYFIRREELRRVNLRNRLQREHLESQKLKELDHLKSRFFANISHEFRTPLTLIMGPIEDLLKTGNSDQFIKILPEVHRNSERLLQLINQLLDLSKLDAKKYRINTTREDIIPFVKQITASFESFAQRKNIDLQFEVDPLLEEMLSEGETKFYFDEDMIEKIMNNLLSNAFKFTGESGQIKVSLRIDETKKDFLEFSVKDSGVGIPAEKLINVFDRFFQADSSNEKRYEGSGIGLALLKELTDLLGGEVAVESEVNKGSTFFCLLPFNKKIITSKTALSPHQTPIKISGPAADQPEPLSQTTTSNTCNVILIVEDHPDVRKYIKGKLEDSYSVIEADNGTDGLQLAQSEIPDLIISDVMMPGMDGFQLCEKLKTDNLTSHIPIILLTAKAEDNDRLAGLETGADAYLVKPFNSVELHIRIKKLIELRKKLRTKFSDKLVIKPSDITVTSLDQEFMKKLMSSIENHISDAKYSVTQLAGEMNMSVSQLNRKLKALIEQSPQKLIRSIRMQRALELLKNDAGNISEVSWEVGFEDPSYFSRVFKSHYGCHPSEKEKLP